MIPLKKNKKGRLLLRDKWGQMLPLRKLGKTGEEVTMLGVGGYHVGWTSEKNAQAVIEKAMEQGIRFFDSAYSYGDGTSERRYGKYLIPKYRDDVFVMSKSTGKTYDIASKELDESLRRMNVDVLDLWQIHSLQSPEDVDARIENGVLRVVEEALKAGKIRFAGFTGHANPYAHLRMIEQAGSSGLFSTAQMPINLVDAASEHSFVEKVVPAVKRQELGLLAMKTLADGRFFGKKTVNDKEIWNTPSPVVPNKISVKEALQFAWSLPISVLITGAENPTLLEEKIELALAFSEVPEKKREMLVSGLLEAALDGKVEYYKNI
jgi:aryl-alcohol dehydrogenase-like predicted oxidoreductase